MCPVGKVKLFNEAKIIFRIELFYDKKFVKRFCLKKLTEKVLNEKVDQIKYTTKK